MKYRVKKTLNSAGTSAVGVLILAAVFIGILVGAVIKIIHDCRGDFSGGAILMSALENCVFIMFGLFLGIVGFYFLYVLFLVRPMPYLATVTEVVIGENGQNILIADLSENQKTRATADRTLKLLMKDACPLAVGDSCILMLKEATDRVQTVEAAAESADADAPNVRTERRSYMPVMNILFPFIIAVFAVAGISALFVAVPGLKNGVTISGLITVIAPTAFCIAAVRYGFKAWKQFRRDNDKTIKQEATGFGQETGVPAMPMQFYVKRSMTTVMNQLPDITISDRLGNVLYKIDSPVADPHGCQIINADGTQIGTVRLRTQELDEIQVSLPGGRNFTVRRMLLANSHHANFEITGLDFKVEGMYQEAAVRSLDGKTAAILTSSADLNMPMQVDVQPGFQSNLYLGIIAGCVVISRSMMLRRDLDSMSPL